jgi:hypothetical protein
MKTKLFLIFAVLIILLFCCLKESFSSSVGDGERCETNSSEIRIQNGEDCTLINCNKGYTPDYTANNYKGTCNYIPDVCEPVDSSSNVIRDPRGFYTYNTDSNCTLNRCDINYASSSNSCKYSKSTIGTKCTTTDAAEYYPQDINNKCIPSSCKTGYYMYGGYCLFDWSKTDFSKSAIITQPSGSSDTASISFTMQGDNPNRNVIQVSVPINLSGTAKTTVGNSQDLNVILTSVSASMTKNGNNFTIFTTNFQSNISKQYKITSKTGVTVQQPFTQLNLKFTPDDSRKSDKYTITYKINYKINGATFRPKYTNCPFGLNLGFLQSFSSGVTYVNTDGIVSLFKIGLSLSS